MDDSGRARRSDGDPGLGDNDGSGSDKEQARYDEAEMYFLKAIEGHHLKLGDTHPHTSESWNNLTDLYEAWKKPEEAEKWRAKLSHKEAARE